MSLPTWAVVVITFAGLLAASGLINALVKWLGAAALEAGGGAAVGPASRLPPGWRRSGRRVLGWPAGSGSDGGSSFPAVARLFVGISRRVPGGRRADTAAVILPILVVGLPLFAVFVLAVWVGPIYLLAWVVLSGPRPWSIPLGFLATGAYFGVLLAGRRLVLEAG